MFQQVGLPITEKCLQGYNGTVLCYGQTGSGKTYTIFGNSMDTISDSALVEKEPLRGLVPRVFEHLWESFGRSKAADDKFSYTCHCAFYEIYQERVFDLLDMSGAQTVAGLSVREDAKEGVYVEGCTEQACLSVQDAHSVLLKGYQNRHVAETNMNRESSRSHAVFQLSLETGTENADGIVVRRKARFSMVDLAGSERQRDTNASGERLKEASVINKSLSTLGHVINTLADVASNGGRKHIHYRDSKLTFLLRDSLGGNSKTTLIATVSPAELCMAETLSTLKFAQRAKAIQNQATVNEESSGSLEALQREIAALRAQLLAEGSGAGSAAGVAVAVAGSAVAVAAAATDGSAGGVEGSLKDALQRCRFSEEQRQRSEADNAALRDKANQFEKGMMSIKLMLKMRESDIARLKKKEPADDSAESTEERVRVAVENINQEMKCQKVKDRAAIKELERTVAELKAGAGAGDTPWTPALEVSFNHDMLVRLQQQEAAVAAMGDMNARLAEGRFAEEFGFSPAEAQDMKSKLAVTEHRLEDSLGRLTQLNEGVVLLKTLLDDEKERGARAADALRAELAAERAERERDALAAQAQSLAQSSSMEELRREAGERDEFILQLEGGMQKSDSELKEQLRVREGEFKTKMNLVLKDNAVLLKRCRELEGALTEFRVTLDVAVKSREAQKILVENSRLTIESMAAAHAAALEELRAECAEAAEAAERSAAGCAAATAEAAALTAGQLASASRIAELEEGLRQARQELAKAQFEAENAVEDADNLFSQTQALIDERQQLLGTLEQSQGELTRLRAEAGEARDAVSAATAAAQSGADTLAEKLAELEALQDALATARGSVSDLQADGRSLEGKVVCLEQQAEERRAAQEALQSSHAAALSALETDLTASLTTSVTTALTTELQSGFDAKLSEQASAHAQATEQTRLGHKAAVEALNAELLAEMAKEFELEQKVNEAADAEAQSQDKTHELELALRLEEEKFQLSVSQNAALQLKLTEQERCSAEGAAEQLASSGRVAELEESLQAARREAEGAVEEARCNADREAAAAAAAGELGSLRLRVAELAEKASASDAELEQASSRLASEAAAAADLRETLAEAQRAAGTAEGARTEAARQLADLQAEHAALCGHQNNKQKIQQHMTLKKDLQEQTMLLKQQQDQLIQMSFERDAARAESKRLRGSLKAVETSSKPNSLPPQPASVKAKTLAGADSPSPSAQSNCENVANSSLTPATPTTPAGISAVI
jgi:kinesin family protein 15